MRRFLSILLLAVFGLPLLTPVLALADDGDAGLPACCRRTGRHHCAMSMEERSRLGLDSGPQWSAPLEKCPYCPASVAIGHVNLYAGGRPHLGFAGWVNEPTAEAQTESLWRAARERARGKRGPPHTLLFS